MTPEEGNTGAHGAASSDEETAPAAAAPAAAEATAAEAEEVTDAEVVEGEVVDDEDLDGDVSGISEAAAEFLQEEESEDPLTIALRERDDYLDALRRLQADFDNYRKRVNRQEQEVQARAAERLISDLLPSLDAFELAAAHLGSSDEANAEAKVLLQAVSLLNDTLTKAGLERDSIAGAPFDPNAHQAVEHLQADESQTSDGADKGPVVDTVLRTGYRWKGRVLRPAMVKVRG